MVGKPSWAIRRRIVISTLLFCGSEIVYLTIWGKDTDLASTIANGILLLAGSVIGSYVFGVVWDDKLQRAPLGGSRRVEVETVAYPTAPPPATTSTTTTVVTTDPGATPTEPGSAPG